MNNPQELHVAAEPISGREIVFLARGITKVYEYGEVKVHALRGVDLDLYRGEFVVLLGPSGSGKSTLLNILGGLDVPSSGTVHYRDHDLTADDDASLTLYRREHVGFVFQFYNLIPSLTACLESKNSGSMSSATLSIHPRHDHGSAMPTALRRGSCFGRRTKC